jgi:S-formylglutathione hydrolase FrmB
MVRRITAVVCMLMLGPALTAHAAGIVPARSRSEPRHLSPAASAKAEWRPLADEPAAAARPRRIRTVRLISDALGSLRQFGLLLPPDYETSARRYPVVYLLHGSGQQHATWGRAALLDHTTGAIVVMPDMDRTRYVLSDGVVDPHVETFITRELIDHIDATYRTLPSRESRAIAGLSIGGLGAMLLGLRHPDRFGAIGSFSAPLNSLGNTRPLLDSGGSNPRPLIYVGCGIADSLLPASRRFAALLQDQQIARKYEEGPGAHTWEAWDWQLRSFLGMLRY